MDQYKQCMCCGYHTLPTESIFEICPLCGWQDDGVQNNDPNYDGGANKLSLNTYRNKWLSEHKSITVSKRTRDVA